MRAVEDSNDAAFGALRTESAAGPALNFCQDMVAVHGVFDGVARNEDVAIELRHRSIGDDKAIAVVMEDQAAFYFILIRERGALGLLAPDRNAAVWPAASAFLFAAREAVAAAGQFLDGMAFLELREHFEERPGVGLFQVQALRDLVGGRRLAPNLQKTQYVIGAEM